MIASECSPVAKAGGLGDMVFGLAREIEIRGNAVEIVLPKYARMRYQDIWDLQVTYEDLWVPWYGGAIRVTVWFGFVHGRKCYFLEPHSAEGFFVRAQPYGYHDDVDRFAFFSKAALEFLQQAGKRPGVIHCHDWQTGLVPVLLYEQYQQGLAGLRVCLTVHNFGHQGVTDEHVLWAAGLGRPEYFRHPERLGDGYTDAVNLLQGGIVYANAVTTVSKNHAAEVRFGDQGNGLGHTLQVHRDKFHGVRNGVDYHVWNAEIDPLVPVRYSVRTLVDKQGDTRSLRRCFGLPERAAPVVAFLGRLAEQKGMHLVHHAIFYTLARGGQFVLLGDLAAHQGINDHFLRLRDRMTDEPDVHLEIGYTEELAHLVYAGADILVVPSLFEPCGLAPMTALRYGTVPVVRAVGGMVDTVFDWDYSDRPVAERNGFVFQHTDEPALESALSRALGLWFADRVAFQTLAANAMRTDYSWSGPGASYLDIYRSLH